MCLVFFIIFCMCLVFVNNGQYWLVLFSTLCLVCDCYYCLFLCSCFSIFSMCL